MGRTKATLEVGGRAMADRVADALRSAGIRTVTLIGGDPVELGALSSPVIADRHPGQGPVGGVLTALENARIAVDHHGVEAVVVVSCDLVDLDGDTVVSLVDARTAEPGRDVWVADTGRIEPMCALWGLSALAEVSIAFADGERTLHRVIRSLDHRTVSVASGPLRNVNRPDDLTGFDTDR
jgi:molybdopterin-guanine dinucleotide biosynthesis protein A